MLWEAKTIIMGGCDGSLWVAIVGKSCGAVGTTRAVGLGVPPRRVPDDEFERESADFTAS